MCKRERERWWEVAETLHTHYTHIHTALSEQRESFIALVDGTYPISLFQNVQQLRLRANFLLNLSL